MSYHKYIVITNTNLDMARHRDALTLLGCLR